MNEEQAIVLVESSIEVPEPVRGQDRVRVIRAATIRKPYAFVLFVNSERYLESRDRRYCLIGVGPVIVDTQRLQIRMLPSCFESDESIARYEKGEDDGALVCKFQYPSGGG